MYTLIVGNQDWSSWSLRPYLALMAVGAPFELDVIRLRQPPDTKAASKANILKHSPAGKVPILKFTENGKSQTIWDSLAICETLAERHPQAQLWPKDAGPTLGLTRVQLDALVLGLPWQRLGEAGVITVL